jgi:ADP-heptose:LPS heptosyltransferase
MDRWVALIARLQAATARPVVLVGGRSDAALAARIVEQCGCGPVSSGEGRRVAVRGAQHARPPSAVMEGAAPSAPRLSSLAGRTTLEELVAALGQAALFVGGDSGLAHLAVAVGTPTVVLFGPSDSRKWGARGSGHAVVRRELACAPCAMFGYHKLCRSIACMDGITVDAVAAACLDRLGSLENGFIRDWR